MLRCFNRMNDLIPSARLEGQVLFGGQDIYRKDVDPVEVRRRIGMVFQKPNPFPKSIYDNVAWGAKINGYKGDMSELVEQSLRDRRRCGTRSRTSSSRARWRSPAASSSGCASPAPSPSSPTSS